MKKTIIALAVAASSLPALAQKAPEPNYTLSANVGLFSDYRFRGVSQTANKPALQGGFDFAHKSGFYAGNWNSSISTFDFDSATQIGSSGLESDFYAGYKVDLGGFGLDFGNIYYYYAGEGVTDLAQLNEVYVGLSYGPVNFKSYYTTSDGSAGVAAKGSYYHLLSVAFPLSDTISLKGSYGAFVAKENAVSYRDYSVGLAFDMGEGWSLGVSYIGTSGDAKDLNQGTALEDLYKSGAVVSISRSF